MSGAAELWSLGDYARVAERLMPVAEQLVDAAGIEAGSHVLDVAAGSGNVSVVAAGRGAKVTATDIAPRMLELGRERTAGLDVTWAEADATALPYEDGAFAAALSVFGAMFAPDQAAAARELLRVVAPGGPAAMSAWVADGMQYEANAYVMSLTGGSTLVNEWGDADHARSLFEAAGATDVAITRHAMTWSFASADAWLDFFEQGPGPFVAARALLNDRWPEVRARLLEIAAPHTDGDGGPLTFEHPYLLIVARR